jgi:hypothetical protein
MHGSTASQAVTNSKNTVFSIKRFMGRHPREGPYPRSVLLEWLTEQRDLERETLSRGAYIECAPAPRRLHPKSATWRSMQALAKPLTHDERADLETVVAVANKWLAILDHADKETVGLLSDAMVLVRAKLRSGSAFLYRVHRPDLDDALRDRERVMALLRYGRLAAEEKRRLPREKIEEAVRTVWKEDPSASWRKICDEAGSRE